MCGLCIYYVNLSNILLSFALNIQCYISNFTASHFAKHPSTQALVGFYYAMLAILKKAFCVYEIVHDIITWCMGHTKYIRMYMYKIRIQNADHKK